MAPTPGADGGERRFGLDLARAAAIGLVVAAHALLLVPLAAPVRERLLLLGAFFGVDLFFVLSGYLIGGILVRSLGAPPEAGPLGARLRRFWIRRWFRTLPCYYLFLGIDCIAWSLLFAPTLPRPSSLLFLQNVAWARSGST